MNVVFKYPLAVEDVQDVEMHAKAAILAIHTQGETPCLWAVVDACQPKMKRRFRTYGTGHPMDDEKEFPHYVGTYQLRGGALVFHVFTDRIERPLR